MSRYKTYRCQVSSDDKLVIDILSQTIEFCVEECTDMCAVVLDRKQVKNLVKHLKKFLEESKDEE